MIERMRAVTDLVTCLATCAVLAAQAGCHHGCGCASHGVSADVAKPAVLLEHAGAPAAPAHADAAASAQGRPYGGQRTCPVTGEPLGSMGPAIPVAVGTDTVYVCCKGCVTKVQRDPSRYLAKVAAERGTS